MAIKQMIKRKKSIKEKISKGKESGVRVKKLIKGEKQYNGIPYYYDKEMDGFVISTLDHPEFDETIWQDIDHHYASERDVKDKIDSIQRGDYGNNFKQGGFLDKTKSLLKTGYEKGKEYGKKGYEKSKELYGKGKESVKQKIHDKKKDIAIEVLDETRGLVPNKKESQMVRGASEFVEEYYAKGGRIISKDNAKNISSHWHGGQESALYQFASSGVYLPENHLRYLQEVQQNINYPEQAPHPYTLAKKDEMELNSLKRFFEYKGEENGIKTEWGKHSVYGYPIPYISKDTPDEIANKIKTLKYLYSEGGYAGKTAEQVWNGWNKAQRTHFLRDHFEDINITGESDGLKYTSTIGLANKEVNNPYDKLPSAIRRVIAEHIRHGQYAKGGKAASKELHVTHFPNEQKYSIWDNDYNLVKEWFPSRESAEKWIKDNGYTLRTGSPKMAKGGKMDSSLKNKIIDHLEENYDVPHHTAERMVEEKNNEINSLIENDEHDVATISRQILGVGDLNYSFSKGGKISTILKEYRKHIDKYKDSGINRFADEKDMIRMFNKDHADHLQIIEYMQSGEWKNAYDKWAYMDTASREETPKDAYELLMKKSGHEDAFYAKGGKINSSFQYTPLTRSMQLAHDVLAETNSLMKKEFSKKELDFIKEKELVYVNAYSNGREHGYHLVSYPLAVSFSENRNSDDLIMYFGKAYSDFAMQGNVPNESSYESREYIPYGNDQIKKGAERLIKFIKYGVDVYKTKEEKDHQHKNV